MTSSGSLTRWPEARTSDCLNEGVERCESRVEGANLSLHRARRGYNRHVGQVRLVVPSSQTVAFASKLPQLPHGLQMQHWLLQTHCPLGDVQFWGEQDEQPPEAPPVTHGPKQSVQFTANAAGVNPHTAIPAPAAALNRFPINLRRDTATAAACVKTSKDLAGMRDRDRSSPGK
jgi:hypothetical protein